MTRTWVLGIGLVAVLGCVGTAQELYTDLVPINIPAFDFTGVAPIGDYSGFAIIPGAGSEGSLEDTLGGIQGMLTIFEGSSGPSGVPTTLLPGFANLPDLSLMQIGMGVQQPADIGSFVNNGVGALPDFSGQGQTTNVVLPTFPLTVGSFGAFDISAFSSLQMN